MHHLHRCHSRQPLVKSGGSAYIPIIDRAAHSSSQRARYGLATLLLPVANQIKQRPLDLLPQRALFISASPHRSETENRTAARRVLRSVEIRDTRGGLFDSLTPVLVTGIQPDQVLGLKQRFPRRRRGAALISVTSTEMRRGEIADLRYVVSWAMQSAILSAPP